LGQPFGHAADAARGPWVQLLQYGHHLMAHPVAAEACLVVAGIQPERHSQLLADQGGFSTAEQQQRPGEEEIRRQGALRPQAGQAAAMAAAGQLQQQGFGPVAGGVSRDHMAHPASAC
jgi:hypothetical protein